MSTIDSGRSGPPLVDRPDRATIRRAATAGGIGQAVETFEFTIYGAAVPYLAHIFFPGTSPTAALLSTWAVFGVAFLGRPLGGYVFGSLGDRIGRRRVLSTVILIMSGATIGIGLVPSYSTIGLLAPVLLVLLRLVQGFSAGGEATGAMAYLAEYAEPTRRARMVSIWQISSYVGVACATVITSSIVALIGVDAFAAGGWRVLFIVAGLLGGIGLYLRTRLPDTPEFATVEAVGEVAASPLRESLRLHRRQMLIVAGLAIWFNFAFYFALVYVPTLMVGSLGISSGTVTLATIVTVALAVLVCPLSGALADRVGRRPTLILGAAVAAVVALPCYWLMTTGVAGAIVGFVVLALAVAIYSAVFPTAMTELFPTRTRYSGMSIVYATCGAVFGGGAPYFSAWLRAETASNAAPFVLAIALALVSMVVALVALPETKDENAF